MKGKRHKKGDKLRLMEKLQSKCRKRCMKTHEEWFGTYDGGLVELRLLYLIPFNKVWKSVEWRVCVWGNDDHGLERDFKEYEEALAMYESITDYTTKEEFKILHGFWNA